MGDILNISASAIISEISCKELIIKQKYKVTNIFRFRVLLLIQFHWVVLSGYINENNFYKDASNFLKE